MYRLLTVSLHVHRRHYRQPLKSTTGEISFKPVNGRLFGMVAECQLLATGGVGSNPGKVTRCTCDISLTIWLYTTCLSCFPTRYISCRSEMSHCTGHPIPGSRSHTPPDGRPSMRAGGIFLISLRLAVVIKWFRPTLGLELNDLVDVHEICTGSSKNSLTACVPKTL